MGLTAYPRGLKLDPWERLQVLQIGMQRVGTFGVLEIIKEIAKALDDRLLKRRGEFCERRGAHLLTKVGEDGCDAVDRARDMGIAQQVEGRQFRRGYLHAACIRLVILDGPRNVSHVLAIEDRKSTRL